MNIKPLYRFLLCFIVITGFFSSTVNARTSDTQPTAQVLSKQLTLSMGRDSYPFQFVDMQGRPKGLLIDMWRAWGEVMGVELTFIAKPWKESIELLKEGRVDLHVGMAKNSSRAEIFKFAKPLTYVDTFLYLHHTIKKPANFSDITHHSVGVVEGAAHTLALLNRDSGFTFTRYAHKQELLNGVIDGEVMAFASVGGLIEDFYQNQALFELFPIANRVRIEQVMLTPALHKTDKITIEQLNHGFGLIDSNRIKQIELRWLGRTKDQHEVKIVMPTNFEPYSGVGDAKQAYGLFIDLWQLWSLKTGINVEFIEETEQQRVEPKSPSEYILDNLNSVADIKIGFNDDSSDKSRWHESQLIYKTQDSLFIHKNADLNLYNNEWLVAVEKGAEYIDSLAKQLPQHIKLKTYTNLAAMMEAAIAGEVSGIMGPSAWVEHQLIDAGVLDDFILENQYRFDRAVYAKLPFGQTYLSELVIKGFSLFNRNELIRLERKWVLDSQQRYFDNSDSLVNFSAQQQSIIKQFKKLKVGYLKDWHPMEFQDDTGDFSGVNYNVINEISTQLDIDIEPIAFERWHDLLQALIDGDVELVGSVAKTPKRESQLLYSEPYWPSPWGLATNTDEVLIYNLSQLSEKRVAIIEGYQLINKLIEAKLGIEIIIVPDTQAGLQAVSKGHADAFIDKVVNLAASLNIGGYNRLKMSVLADFAEQHSYLGLHPSKKELLPLINQIIRGISPADLQAIYQYWLVNEGASQASYPISLSYKIIIGILFLLLIMVTVNCQIQLRKLKQQYQDVSAKEIKPQ